MLTPGIVQTKKVLVAPLDWGLGHATRCIPLIRVLMEKNYQVFVAGEGHQKSLLQTEFPQLNFLDLPGYRVHYGVSAVQTVGQLLRQLPQIRQAIQHEHKWLAQMMNHYSFDAVISDNRYGLYHPAAHCVFITHQLRIQVPFSIISRLVQRFHYRMLRPFQECWVPDVPEWSGLAGHLSHPQWLPPLPVQYVGPLSRFRKKEQQAAGAELLLLLSGPEPQRSVFEQILLQQFVRHPVPAVLVRGLPAGSAPLQVPPNVRVYNHLSAAALEAELQKAAWVICRSGYSTIMDLAALGKKSILVPTPGQTEQVYLAKHLQQKGFAFWQRQRHFNLTAALLKAESFFYRPLEIGGAPLLNDAVDALDKQLAKRLANNGVPASGASGKAS